MLQSTISSADASESSPLLAAINDTALLDQSVEEVFALMLGTPVTVSEPVTGVPSMRAKTSSTDWSKRSSPSC